MFGSDLNQSKKFWFSWSTFFVFGFKLSVLVSISSTFYATFFADILLPSESCGLVGSEDGRKIVGSNPVTGMLDGSGVRDTQV